MDILFNCAGWVHQGSLLDCATADWDRSFNLNVRSMFVMTKAMLPRMISAGGGVFPRSQKSIPLSPEVRAIPQPRGDGDDAIPCRLLDIARSPDRARDRHHADARLHELTGHQE